MDFGLSGIPPTAFVVNAKLNLYATGQLGTLKGHTGTKNAAKLEVITESWDENSVTWNNQPNSSNKDTVALLQSTSANQDYLDIDVTSLISSNHKNQYYGIMLKQTHELSTNALLFCSSDYADVSKRPSLNVCYIDTTPSSTSISEEVILEKTLVYPNPSSGRFVIEVTSEINSIILLDQTGRLISKIAPSNKIISYEVEKSRIYFIHVQSENSEQVIKVAVIK